MAEDNPIIVLHLFLQQRLVLYLDDSGYLARLERSALQYYNKVSNCDPHSKFLSFRSITEMHYERVSQCSLRLRGMVMNEPMLLEQALQEFALIVLKKIFMDMAANRIRLQGGTPPLTELEFAALYGPGVVSAAATAAVSNLFGWGDDDAREGSGFARADSRLVQVAVRVIGIPYCSEYYATSVESFGKGLRGIRGVLSAHTVCSKYTRSTVWSCPQECEYGYVGRGRAPKALHCQMCNSALTECIRNRDCGDLLTLRIIPLEAFRGAGAPPDGGAPRTGTVRFAAWTVIVADELTKQRLELGLLYDITGVFQYEKQSIFAWNITELSDEPYQIAIAVPKLRLTADDVKMAPPSPDSTDKSKRDKTSQDENASDALNGNNIKISLSQWFDQNGNRVQESPSSSPSIEDSSANSRRVNQSLMTTNSENNDHNGNVAHTPPPYNLGTSIASVQNLTPSANDRARNSAQADNLGAHLRNTVTALATDTSFVGRSWANAPQQNSVPPKITALQQRAALSHSSGNTASCRTHPAIHSLGETPLADVAKAIKASPSQSTSLSQLDWHYVNRNFCKSASQQQQSSSSPITSRTSQEMTGQQQQNVTIYGTHSQPNIMTHHNLQQQSHHQSENAPSRTPCAATQYHGEHFYQNVDPRSHATTMNQRTQQELQQQYDMSFFNAHDGALKSQYMPSCSFPPMTNQERFYQEAQNQMWFRPQTMTTPPVAKNSQMQYPALSQQQQNCNRTPSTPATSAVPTGSTSQNPLCTSGQQQQRPTAADVRYYQDLYRNQFYSNAQPLPMGPFQNSPGPYSNTANNSNNQASYSQQGYPGCANRSQYPSQFMTGPPVNHQYHISPNQPQFRHQPSANCHNNSGPGSDFHQRYYAQRQVNTPAAKKSTPNFENKGLSDSDKAASLAFSRYFAQAHNRNVDEGQQRERQSSFSAGQNTEESSMTSENPEDVSLYEGSTHEETPDENANSVRSENSVGVQNLDEEASGGAQDEKEDVADKNASGFDDKANEKVCAGAYNFMFANTQDLEDDLDDMLSLGSQKSSKISANCKEEKSSSKADGKRLTENDQRSDQVKDLVISMNTDDPHDTDIAASASSVIKNSDESNDQKSDTDTASISVSPRKENSPKKEASESAAEYKHFNKKENSIHHSGGSTRPIVRPHYAVYGVPADNYQAQGSRFMKSSPPPSSEQSSPNSASDVSMGSSVKDYEEFREKIQSNHQQQYRRNVVVRELNDYGFAKRIPRDCTIRPRQRTTEGTTGRSRPITENDVRNSDQFSENPRRVSSQFQANDDADMRIMDMDVEVSAESAKRKSIMDKYRYVKRPKSPEPATIVVTNAAPSPQQVIANPSTPEELMHNERSRVMLEDLKQSIEQFQRSQAEAQYRASLEAASLRVRLAAERVFSVAGLYRKYSRQSPFAFVQILAAKMGESETPIEEFAPLKIGLLLSLASINTLSDEPPVHVVALGQESLIAQRLFVIFGKYAKRFVAPTEPVTGGAISKNIWLEAGHLLLTRGGTCLLGDWTRYYNGTTNNNPVISALESGKVKISASKTDGAFGCPVYVLKSAMWTYWNAAPESVKGKTQLMQAMNLFGVCIPCECKDDELMAQYTLDGLTRDQAGATKKKNKVLLDDVMIPDQDIEDYLDRVSRIPVVIGVKAERLMQSYFVASRRVRMNCVPQRTIDCLKLMAQAHCRLCHRQEVLREDALVATLVCEASLSAIWGPGPIAAPVLKNVHTLKKINKFMHDHEVWLDYFITMMIGDCIGR